MMFVINVTIEILLTNQYREYNVWTNIAVQDAVYSLQFIMMPKILHYGANKSVHTILITYK